MSAQDIAFQAELENDPNGICETPTMLKSSYRFLRCLGEGAQGRTYLAEKKDTGELVAVKELKMNTADAFKGFELFMRESEVLADLDDPGVPKFYERIIPKDGNGSCYIVQEFCQNPSIQSTLDLNVRNAKKCFSVMDVLEIIRSTAEILERLEKNYTPPIVHRDIKPSNILYSKVQGEIRCWLIDFGAVANPQKRSASSTIAGTCGYMAPEQLMGMCTPASDIYSLGMTAVHMLTEIAPWTMPVKDLEIQYDAELRRFGPELSDDFVKLLHRMTAVSLEDRIGDASDLLRHPLLAKGRDLKNKRGKDVETHAGDQLYDEHRAVTQNIKATIFLIFVVLVFLSSLSIFFVVSTLVFKIWIVLSALVVCIGGVSVLYQIVKFMIAKPKYDLTIEGRVIRYERADAHNSLVDKIEYLYHVDGWWYCGRAISMFSQAEVEGIRKSGKISIFCCSKNPGMSLPLSLS